MSMIMLQGYKIQREHTMIWGNSSTCRLSTFIMHGFNSKDVILATNIDARPDNAIPTAFEDERLVTGANSILRFVHLKLIE